LPAARPGSGPGPSPGAGPGSLSALLLLYSCAVCGVVFISFGRVTLGIPKSNVFDASQMKI